MRKFGMHFILNICMHYIPFSKSYAVHTQKTRVQCNSMVHTIFGMICIFSFLQCSIAAIYKAVSSLGQRNHQLRVLVHAFEIPDSNTEQCNPMHSYEVVQEQKEGRCLTK